MHGKISRYSMATGSGVVINHSKKIFELRKEHWHDRRMLPATGMYVECRLDENGAIIDAHSSAYQEFGENSLVREIDFWRTNTDEELRTKESDLRNKITEEIFQKTNYLEMQSIVVSIPIEDCLREYFVQEFNSIKFALSDVEEIPSEKQLNYMVIRRFLNKAMDYLMYCDRNVTLDVFALDLQKLHNLEYFFKGLMQSSNLKASSIYLDVFLEKQLHYKGAIKAILGIKEKVIQLRNKSKFCSSEMRRLRNQMEINKKDTTLAQKIEAQKNSMLKANEEIGVLTQCQERLENLTKAFKENYFQEFSKKLKVMHIQLLDQTKSTLNLVCTILDDKIWKISMGSTAVINSFFKHDINSSYCAMTFYWQYLKRLDKNKLADNEKQGYNYYCRYKKLHEKLFLIYAINDKLEMYLKIQIMSASKDYSVVIAKTDGEFLTFVNRQVFETIYIGPFIKGNPKQIAEETKKSKLNQNTKVVIISQQQALAFTNRNMVGGGIKTERSIWDL